MIDDDVPVAPACCITDDAAILALYPQTIRAYLSRGDDFRSLGEQPAVAKALTTGKGPTLLAYQDTPRLLELAYPFVQIGARIATAELQREGLDVDETLLPSLQALRRHLRPGMTSVVSTEDGLEVVSRHSVPAVGGAPWLIAAAALSEGRAFEDVADGLTMAVFPAKAREVQSMNNLRQIALAMHNHHDQHGKFPAAYSAVGDKPLLSWRVHILPYLEEGALYREFHLDEPWDSEHNKQLIPRMPALYIAPGSKAGEGRTNYLTPRGEGTIFPGKEALSLAKVLDGTSNTILVVEAGDEKAVVWTKPDDYEFDPMNPTRGLPGLRSDVILATFADGAVYRLRKDLGPETFRRLFLRADGEIVDFDRR
jgi:hypothetical protein